jgi:hypothetical protein
MLSVVSIHFSDNAAATQNDGFGYCASSPDQSDVYFSEIFKAGPVVYITSVLRLRRSKNSSKATRSISSHVFRSIGSSSRESEESLTFQELRKPFGTV